MIPKLTVFFPTYNYVDGFKRNALIARAVNRQFCGGINFVVSDDSTDPVSAQMIRDIAFQNNIEYIQGPQCGAVMNWNSCLNLLSSDYGIFIHHDEYPHSKSFYEDLLKRIYTTNVRTLFIFDLIKANGSKCFYHYPLLMKKLFLICKTFVYSVNPFGSPSVMAFHKDIVQSFDAKLKWHVDVDWFYDLLRHSDKIVFCDEAIVSDLDFEKRITNQLDIIAVKSREEKYINSKYGKNIFMPYILRVLLKFPMGIARLKSVFL